MRPTRHGNREVFTHVEVEKILLDTSEKISNLFFESLKTSPPRPVSIDLWSVENSVWRLCASAINSMSTVNAELADKFLYEYRKRKTTFADELVNAFIGVLRDALGSSVDVSFSSPRFLIVNLVSNQKALNAINREFTHVVCDMLRKFVS
ncbi:MAG: hypothetical protein DRJ31_05775 [Candidatus Methanomethylicota archaeon]|uniref:Uncharacterized protein n=1 Tax=Thermoproteota archaeon TaxID=2056631 RepID=A0A497ER82_9CREN|nr:MAG: hypothetical protein DRJ31_05775 [Candidatus Verstraetearchaeota archaeon]RLE52836.1 MAG: hypothetical protein DRJ33_02680 [Candidatus Verstraetearchaeota archaeon]